MGDKTTIFDHEVRLVKIETTLEDVKGDTDEILGLLRGDNGEGLTTKVALVKQSVNRLWFFVGPMILAMLTTAVSYAVK